MTHFGVAFFPNNIFFISFKNVAYPTLFAHPGFVTDIEFKRNAGL
jgi:hypothetical protein